MKKLRNFGGGAPGFTLAEVLITLGIIGVVAAMTMPSLISKYQMKTLETAFKKQYAVFQDAINFISLEDSVTECSIYYNSGNLGYSFRSSDCPKLREALIERLGLSPIKYDYPYAKKSELLAGGGKTINGACATDDGFQNTKSYITKDGAIVLIHNRSAFMTIDVNGKKGPNKWGYDVFYFTLTTNNSADRILLTDELCSVIEKGGRFPRTILQNSDENKDTNWFWK